MHHKTTYIHLSIYSFIHSVFYNGIKFPSLGILKTLSSGKVNCLPNDITLDLASLKAFADDKLNVAEMTIFYI